jgi:CRP-like cAMP-binding protein
MLTPRDVEHLKSLLGRRVLLALLDDATAARLTQAVELVAYPAGAMILTEGEPGDTAYLVRSGRLTVTRKGEDGVLVTMASLGPGDLLGEFAVLRDEVRSASVRTDTDVSLFQIRRDDFQTLLRDNPALAERVELLIRRRGLMDFLRLSTVLQFVPPPRLLDLLDQIKEYRVDSGEAIESALRFYVIRTGAVLVARGGIVSVFGEGGHFGAANVLEPDKPPATATALTDAVCLGIEAEPLATLLADVPELRQRL